ncbi:MAG: hypothetical protein HY234_08815 [Acidobacteria bacterium]|nr:hypothetical protein [Acidobacteriota bacterium]
MAYDAARGQVVLFGGADTITGTNFHDTWVWDGANWTQKSPSTSPSGTGSQAMAYDAARQQVVMFGGAVGDNVFNTVISSDTWVWDGTTWTQRFPANSPSPRLGAAMVYDPVRQQVVLFGGGPGSPESFGDTWVWDGNNWTQKFPATSPPARSNFGFAFDVARGQAVLYAGRGDGDTWLNDTWVWDGTNWTQKFPATIPTTPRALHRMAYDASRQQVVLFGGHGPSNDPLYDDTWVWDGVNWTQKFPASSPSGRTGHTLAFDEACAEIVLFGGFTGSFADDTWVWGVPSTDPCVIRVEIDIKPDSFPNSINLGSGGTVPVAIFSSPSFDARTIDPLTVSLAGGGHNCSLARENLWQNLRPRGGLRLNSPVIGRVSKGSQSSAPSVFILESRVL